MTLEVVLEEDLSAGVQSHVASHSEPALLNDGDVSEDTCSRTLGRREREDASRVQALHQ